MSLLGAALIGRSVVAFTPVTSPTYDAELPNSVSTCYPTEEALFEAVAQILRTPGEPEARAAQIWKFVHAGKIGNGSGRLATDIILDMLERTYAGAMPSARGRTAALGKAWSAAIKNGIKRRIQSVLEPRRSRARSSYHNQKFGNISTSEIEGHLFDLGFPGLRAVEQSPFWWRLEPDRASGE